MSKVELHGGVRKGAKANIALLALRSGQQSSEELNRRGYGLSHEMPGLKKLGLVVDVVSGRGQARRSVWALTDAGARAIAFEA